MGVFDVRRAGEPGQRNAAGFRKQKVANDLTPAGLESEKARNAKMLGRVLAVADKPVRTTTTCEEEVFTLTRACE